MSEPTDTVLGARLSMRSAARRILEMLDQMAEHEIAEAGFTREDIAAFERLAAAVIAGVPFGDWPR